jgi:hypothetical protein
MQEIPEELVGKIEALMTEYGIQGFRKADALGQALATMDAGCPANDIKWMTGGLVQGHIQHTKPHLVLKRLVSALEKQPDKHLNYNDMDCNLIGSHHIIKHECLTCCSITASVEKKRGKPVPETKDCPRCKGTGVDPEYHDDAWIIWYDNHGNSQAFILLENCLGMELHIRRLPYNLGRASYKKIMTDITEAAKEDRYETECKWLKCRDERDEGFILSTRWDKPTEHNFSLSHDTHANLHAIASIDDIVEHFICVVESMEKGEEP